ncbi:hypothetical protein [Leptospira licerasiae]|uniref:DUF1145 domain-containing protein n=1 Tax=Leptospira licerasiae str. MMD4847 TaxID=1049971 RepID=A0ABN0HCW7_9LEPT|nr:hypothetical protein [Leptospira licerasiae]EIE00711.1 hypothetical protein LEP1GSC185_0119 [Leptospira licerasiae serovar Varillal str. VAR 010]EJZ43501.1 hypothetical protein LEP1GSC178_2478 [Leptospira licerasiae str. MMD4847]TGM86936.1 hypothetical protein EHR05_18600 [Leptospira licerasiae]
MNLVNSISKASTAAFWLLWLGVLSGIVQLVNLHPSLDGIVLTLGWVILGIHILEVGIYSFRAGSRGGFKISDAAQVFVFGVFHLIPVSFSDKK